MQANASELVSVRFELDNMAKGHHSALRALRKLTLLELVRILTEKVRLSLVFPANANPWFHLATA
jgi:hypothetical protein